MVMYSGGKIKKLRKNRRINQGTPLNIRIFYWRYARLVETTFLIPQKNYIPIFTDKFSAMIFPVDKVQAEMG